MRKVKTKKPPNVVLGLVPAESGKAAAVVQSAPRRKCPVCRTREGTTEMSIGPINVRVCDECGAAAYHGMGLLSALKRFL